MKCPDCKGDGRTYGVFPVFHSSVQSSKYQPLAMLPCERCGGRGDIPSTMAEWIAKGKSVSAARWLVTDK